MTLRVRFSEETDPRTAREQLEAGLEYAKGSGVIDDEHVYVVDDEDSIATVHVATVNVIDPDSKLPVEVEIRKLETGGLVGLDGSFLANTDEDVYSPYDENVKLDIPDDEGPTEKPHVRVPRDIQEAANALGEASKHQNVPPHEIVKLVVSDVLGHAWVDEELADSLLESIAGLFENVTLEDKEEDEDDEAE